MKNDALKQFVALRGQLLREKEELERRLADIHEALGSMPPASQTSPVTQPAPKAPRRPSPRPSPRRPKPPGPRPPSLREAVLAVTRARPLTRHELLKAVVDHGYRFKSKNPLNALSAFLYTDPSVRNIDGRFGPA